MNKMNAFRGTDAASLAFKEELKKLAPGYYLGDLHRHIYMTGQDLVRDACTAYQEALAGEEDLVEYVKPAHPSKPLMKLFLDLGLTKNVIHGNRSSFESSRQNWLSSAKMYHPAFGYFKFEYLMFGQIDYNSCFRVDDTLNHAVTSVMKKYPASSHSWLHALPEALAGDDSDTETLRSTDGQVINNCDGEGIHNSKDLKGSETTGHAAYIPPYKRGDADSSHSRSQSDSVILLSNTIPGRGRVSNEDQSEDGAQWQANTNMSSRTLTGGYYKPHFSLYVSASVHSGSVQPMTESGHSRSLLTQSNYKAKGQGTKAIKDLADNLNCSLFVSHLPEDVKYKEIFAAITTGSVVSVHVNEPIPGHPFSAAKITFKYPEGAARFMALVNSSVGVQIRDHHFAAVYNGYGMVKHAQEHHSRVIHIHGPFKLMAEGFWRIYFGKVTRYQLDHVSYLPFDPNNKVTRSMEFRFARIEAQAQSILITIIHDPQFEGKVICKYGPDPCGKGWETLPTR
ncbi:hypothetical protein BOTNAR_0084g00180 [Botryotinia narcissicola]|uniref:RRM domain-containing protein n=1 Tax=Botryotinia narcissicola TaxID=278944 RepID=A0A4Z1J7D2_9HELO|nr:hypothetical protein BOTNAR_0084g00180 [Botryotinia narcissicola]